MFSQNVRYNQKDQECQSLRTRLAQAQIEMPPPGGSVPVNAKMTVPSPSLGADGGESATSVLKFNGYGEFSGLMIHSPHSLMYEEELYPTALHLFEARRFLYHRPDLADRIRECERIENVTVISAELVDFVRRDWGNVGLRIVSNQFSLYRIPRVCWANLC